MNLANAIIGGVVAATFLGSATAGSPQDASQPRPGVPVETHQIDPPREIIAIGCLAKEGDQLILTDAAVTITPWLASTVHKDAPGAPKALPSKTVFALLNPQGLERHVGQRIEMKGVVAPATANLPASPDTIAPARGIPGITPSAFPGPQGVARLAHPNLDNTGIRVVAPRCSQRPS